MNADLCKFGVLNVMLNGTSHKIRRKLMRQNDRIPIASPAFLTSTHHQIFVDKSSIW